MTFPRGAPGMMDMSCMDMSGRNVSYRLAWINVNVWRLGAAAEGGGGATELGA